ncbi:MAG: hypothetical protein ABI416_03785 [Ginsengibacter sp.]
MLPQNPILVKPYRLYKAADNSAAVNLKKVSVCQYVVCAPPLPFLDYQKMLSFIFKNNYFKISKYNPDVTAVACSDLYPAGHGNLMNNGTSLLMRKVRPVNTTAYLFAKDVSVYTVKQQQLSHNSQKQPAYE